MLTAQIPTAYAQLDMWVFIANSTQSVPVGLTTALACIGPAVAILAAFLTSEFTRKRERRKLIEEYLRLLNATKFELVFLRGILKIARDHAYLSFTGMTGESKQTFHPSYSFDTSYFEKLKFELARSRVTASVLEKVGSSHYELYHLRDRFETMKESLNEYKAAATPKREWSMALTQLSGFITLHDNDQHLFDSTESELNAEISAVEEELRNFGMSPAFSPY